MTDGTSQGLFIVVAIVIFGIFVVLAYILFEDTLSPTMANMFSVATEQATKNLTKFTDEKYFVFDKDTRTITNYLQNLEDAPTDIAIPEYIDGVPVEHIQGGAFFYKNLTSVKFPRTLKTIGDPTDGNATQTVLGSGAFEGNMLTEVVFPNNITYVGIDAFASNRNLERVVFSKNMKAITLHSFNNTNNIKEIVIPEGVEEIHERAFGYSKVTEVHVPKSVRKIDRYAFFTTTLKKLHVSQATVVSPDVFGGINVTIVRY